MKKISKTLISIILFCVLLIVSAVSVSAENENIEFPDSNLKKAIINAGVDSDGNGEISKEEAFSTYSLLLDNAGITDLTGLECFENISYLSLENNEISDISPLKELSGLQTIIIRDNKISDASALSGLKDLEYINIAYNDLTDLTPFLTNTNLSYIDVSNNKLKTSVLNGTDEKTMSQLESLIKIVTTNNSDYGAVYDAYNQKMAYDESLLSENAPTHKVLISVIKEIDATSKVGENGNYHNVQSKYTMSDEEINTIKAYADLFEKYVEKISGYKINIETDFYVTNETLKSIYTPSADYGLYSGYAVYAPDVPELVSKVDQYDATITVCYLNPETHDSSGVAGFGWNEQITGKGNYYQRGIVFIPWDVYGSSEGNFYTAQHANDMCYDALIDTFVHEYIHTLEQYAPVLGYNNIKEFHEALGEWEPRDDAVGVMANYFQCGKYENGLTGIPDIVKNNPPTVKYSTPGKVSGLKCASKGTTYVKLSWKATENATGYKIERYNSTKKKWVSAGTTNKTSITVSNLSSGTTYKFRVSAYKKSGENTNYSKTVSLTATTKPYAPKISSVKRSGTKMTVKLSKVKNASGYEIQLSKKKSFSSISKKITTKKTSATLSKLTKSKKYYVRARAYKVVNGKKIYSSYTKYLRAK